MLRSSRMSFLPFITNHLIMQTFTQAVHTCNYIHGRNDFVEISKNLASYGSENNFVGHQNNCVGSSSIISKIVKNFNILVV